MNNDGYSRRIKRNRISGFIADPFAIPPPVEQEETSMTIPIQETLTRAMVQDTAIAKPVSLRHAVILALCIIGAGVLSLLVFSPQSLRLDEAQSLWQTSHSPVEILEIIGKDVHVPLYHLMLHFWQVFMGNDVVMARLLSVSLFLVSIPLLYHLGRQVYNDSIALFATLLFTISPFMNWYASEIRMYTLMTLLTLLNQYFFIQIYKGKEHAWLGYTISSLLGIFSHYFFVFNLVTQGLFFITHKDSFPATTFRKYINLGILLSVAMGTWIWHVISLQSFSNASPLLLKPTTIDIFNTFSQFLFGFQTNTLNTVLVSLWPLVVLLAFLVLQKNKTIPPLTTYFIMAVFLPITLAFSISFFAKPIYVARYFIFILPALYLVIAATFSAYSKQISMMAKGVLVAVMLFALTVEAANPEIPIKEDYRDAAVYLSANAKAQDIVVISAPFTVYPVEYYYSGVANITTLPIWNRSENGPIPPFSLDTLPKDLDTIKGSHRTLWLLLSYDQGYQEQLRIYMDTHFERVSIKNFSPGIDLYEYKLRYDE
jgi:mannosyltransferase